MSDFATTPKPPYYVVCFSNQHGKNLAGYEQMADLMLALAAEQDGYLGVESARNPAGFGITNSFWRDEASIKAWRNNSKHLVAQKEGRENFYEAFFTRVARVERDHFLTRADE